MTVHKKVLVNNIVKENLVSVNISLPNQKRSVLKFSGHFKIFFLTMNAVVWTVSILPWISNSSSLLLQTFGDHSIPFNNIIILDTSFSWWFYTEIKMTTGLFVVFSQILSPVIWMVKFLSLISNLFNLF